MTKVWYAEAWPPPPTPSLSLAVRCPLISSGFLVQTSGAHSHGPGLPYIATLAKPSICHTIYFSTPFLLEIFIQGERHCFPIINLPMLNTSLVQSLNRIPIYTSPLLSPPRPLKHKYPLHVLPSLLGRSDVARQLPFSSKCKYASWKSYCLHSFLNA